MVFGSLLACSFNSDAGVAQRKQHLGDRTHQRLVAAAWTQMGAAIADAVARP